MPFCICPLFKTNKLYQPLEVNFKQVAEGQEQMKNNRNKLHSSKKVNSCNKRIVLFGVASLIWFIFRTGTKPSRVTYPCQRTALANSSILLGLSIPLWLTSALTKTKKFTSKNGIILLVLLMIANIVLSSSQFLGNLQLAGAADPNQELYLSLEPMQASSSPASNLYVVNGRPIAHVNELINLMGSNGLLFYKSDTNGENQGPNGLIANNDVILIKINSQWNERGGTNTDLLKELIQMIVSHPDNFVGEIVVADNGQAQYGPFGNGGSLNWANNNAEDHSQSAQDVVDIFAVSDRVSTYLWDSITLQSVDEYSDGDMNDGYVVNQTGNTVTGIQVSYPKFQTDLGTYISFKMGIWNPSTESYDGEKLKVINFPVLKSHFIYGVTASMKHYMGVVSAKQTNAHSKVATGGMGTEMVETRFPTLNVLDAIWVNANPPSGPSTPYEAATRVNVLMASTDPVALDYWASKHVLMQTANLIGHTDTRTIDPDSTASFGVWLSLTENEIVDGGYPVTSDENKMNVYVKSEAPPPTPTPSPTPTPGPTPSPSPTTTPTASPTPRPSPSPTPSPTATPLPSPTESPSPTIQPTKSPTPPPAEPPLLLYGLILGTIIMFAAIFAVLLWRK